MTDKSKESLEKIVLAGIGAMTLTAEKSKEIIEFLAKKGALTVEHKKILNEELKRNAKTATSEASNPIKNFIVSGIIQNLDKLTSDERAQILSKLQELNKTEEIKTEETENQG